MEGEALSKDDDKQTTGRSVFPGYALYRYHANRIKQVPSTSTAENEPDTDAKSESSVAPFLSREATVDDNFSLNVVLTSLNAENEMELRKFLAKRLSKGTTYAGSGHIAGLDLSIESDDLNAGASLCYYILLRQESDPEDSGAADVISDPEAAENRYTSNEFMLCLLSSPHIALDLFRHELNQFSQQILDMLDADPILKYDLDCEEVTILNAKVWPLLDNWYDHLSQYLMRCVDSLQESIQYIIHAALSDTKVEVRCKDPKIQEDIQRFVSVCSLSDLVDTMPLDECEAGRGTEPLLDLAEFTSDAQTIVLTQQPDETWKASPEVSSEFCEAWAVSLITQTGDEDNCPVFRQIIDNYKLKAIQDMNTLKRHLRQAESDYYALYRCHVFLKKCGNSRVLLKHVASETGTTHNGCDVLKVLHEQLQQPISAAS